MSRENYFVKATLVKKGKEDKEVSVRLNITNIDAIVDNNGGSTVLMTSGVVYECVQTPEYFIKAGAAYGITKEI